MNGHILTKDEQEHYLQFQIIVPQGALEPGWVVLRTMTIEVLEEVHSTNEVQEAQNSYPSSRTLHKKVSRKLRKPAFLCGLSKDKVFDGLRAENKRLQAELDRISEVSTINKRLCGEVHEHAGKLEKEEQKASRLQLDLKMCEAQKQEMEKILAKVKAVVGEKVFAEAYTTLSK